MCIPRFSKNIPKEEIGFVINVNALVYKAIEDPHPASWWYLNAMYRKYFSIRRNRGGAYYSLPLVSAVPSILAIKP